MVILEKRAITVLRLVSLVYLTTHSQSHQYHLLANIRDFSVATIKLRLFLSTDVAFKNRYNY